MLAFKGYSFQVLFLSGHLKPASLEPPPSALRAADCGLLSRHHPQAFSSAEVDLLSLAAVSLPASNVPLLPF